MSLIDLAIDVAFAVFPEARKDARSGDPGPSRSEPPQAQPHWIVPACIGIFLVVLAVGLITLLMPSHHQVLALLGALDNPKLTMASFGVMALLGLLSGMWAAAGFEDRAFRVICLVVGMSLLFALGVCGVAVFYGLDRFSYT